MRSPAKYLVIVALPPGTCTLRATLPGFVTVRRAEVELSGSQTLTIPIEMRVGGLEETITVAGEPLVVDVQSARRELVLNADVVQRFRPRATPGVNVSEAGLSPTMTSFSARSRGANANSVRRALHGQRHDRVGGAAATTRRTSMTR